MPPQRTPTITTGVTIPPCFNKIFVQPFGNQFTSCCYNGQLSLECPGHVLFPGFGHILDFLGDTGGAWPDESHVHVHVLGISLFLSHEWHLTTTLSSKSCVINMMKLQNILLSKLFLKLALVLVHIILFCVSTGAWSKLYGLSHPYTCMSYCVLAVSYPRPMASDEPKDNSNCPRCVPLLVIFRDFCTRDKRIFPTNSMVKEEGTIIIIVPNTTIKQMTTRQQSSCH